MAARTPTPIRIEQPWAGFSCIRGPNDEMIFGLAAGVDDEALPSGVCEEWAAFIVKAVNNHESLLACYEMLRKLDNRIAWEGQLGNTIAEEVESILDDALATLTKLEED